MSTECPEWKQYVDTASDEHTSPARSAAIEHTHLCSYCGPRKAALDTPIIPTPLAIEKLAPREKRWLRARWTRWFLAASALFIIIEAIPGYAAGDGHGLSSQAHAARHLATWQIGFGAGLLVAAIMSRLTHAMLALAVTFGALTVVATAIDILSGHSGPWAESVHLIELAGVFLLWQLAPPHLAVWHARPDPFPNADDDLDSPEPVLHLVPRDESKDPT